MNNKALPVGFFQKAKDNCCGFGSSGAECWWELPFHLPSVPLDFSAEQRPWQGSRGLPVPFQPYSEAGDPMADTTDTVPPSLELIRGYTETKAISEIPSWCYEGEELGVMEAARTGTLAKRTAREGKGLGR